MKRIVLQLIIALMTVISANAQVKVSSAHSNLEVKVRGCKLEDDVITLNLLITNFGKSAPIKFWTAGMMPENYVVDDEGNRYDGKNMGIGTPDIEPQSLYQSEFPSEIPIKIILTVNGVDANASELKMVSFVMEGYGVKKPITIRNIPIDKD